MGRQILTVLLGVVLSYLVTAAGGYFVFHIQLYTRWSEPQLGALVRYLINPLIAVIVGSVVGALAKKRAGVLAVLSLIPWALVPLFSRRLNALHETILFFSSVLSVCLGVAAAIFIFRVRTRTKPVT